MSEETRPDCGLGCSMLDSPEEFIDDLFLDRPYVLSLDAAVPEGGSGGGSSFVPRG